MITAGQIEAAVQRVRKAAAESAAAEQARFDLFVRAVQSGWDWWDAIDKFGLDRRTTALKAQELGVDVQALMQASAPQR